MTRAELFDAATAPISVQQFFGRRDPGPIVAALANVPEILEPPLSFLGLALRDGATTTRPSTRVATANPKARRET